MTDILKMMKPRYKKSKEFIKGHVALSVGIHIVVQKGG